MSKSIHSGSIIVAYPPQGICALSVHFDGVSDIDARVARHVQEFLVHLVSTKRIKIGQCLRFNGTLELKPNYNFHFDGNFAVVDMEAATSGFPYKLAGWDIIGVSSNY